MSRLKLFIVLGFGIMFVAGLEVGRSHTSISSLQGDWHRLVAKVRGTQEQPPATQPAKANEPRLLLGKIEITPEQDDQIHKIYHEAHVHSDTLNRQFRDLDFVQADEVKAILDPAQRLEYDVIQADHDDRITELRFEINVVIKNAGDAVRAILNPDQQKQYDELRKKYDGGRRNGGNAPRRSGPGRRSHGGPDSAPTTAPDASPAAQ